jgi:CBS domain-containing protein
MGKRVGYGQACDMWSIGVMTYKLLSGRLPFYGATEEHIMMKVLRCNYSWSPSALWEKISSDGKDFISKLLQVDPGARITADQAMKHKWIVAAEQRLSNAEGGGGEMDDVPQLGRRTSLQLALTTPKVQVKQVHLLRALTNKDKNLLIKTRVPEGALAQCSLGDVLPLVLCVLHCNMTLQIAFSFLSERKFSSAPVANEQGKFIGFVDVQDLLTVITDTCGQNLSSHSEKSRVPLSKLLAVTEARAFQQTLKEMLDTRKASVAGLGTFPYFGPQSNLLEVIQQGFLTESSMRLHLHRVPLLSKVATHATNIQLITPEGEVQESAHTAASPEVVDTTTTDMSSNFKAREQQLLSRSNTNNNATTTNAAPIANSLVDYIVGMVTTSNVLQFFANQPNVLGPHLQGKTIHDLGLDKSPFFSVSLSTPAIYAFMIMREENVTGLAVVDEHSRIRANISASDLKGIGLESMQKLSMSVRSFLNQQAKSNGTEILPPVTCTPDDTFAEVIHTMVLKHVHRVYVVNQHHRPLSVITGTIVLRVVSENTEVQTRSQILLQSVDHVPSPPTSPLLAPLKDMLVHQLTFDDADD